MKARTWYTVGSQTVATVAVIVTSHPPRYAAHRCPFSSLSLCSVPISDSSLCTLSPRAELSTGTWFSTQWRGNSTPGVSEGDSAPGDSEGDSTPGDSEGGIVPQGTVRFSAPGDSWRCLETFSLSSLGDGYRHWVVTEHPAIHRACAPDRDCQEWPAQTSIVLRVGNPQKHLGSFLQMWSPKDSDTHYGKRAELSQKV